MSNKKSLSVACACAMIAVGMLAFSAAPAAADVTWNFTETSLSFQSSGQPVPGFVPGVVGSLTVSDADFAKGGISYSFARDAVGNVKVSGDTDFSFLKSTELSAPIVLPDPFIGDRDATLDLKFDSAGNIDGSVQEDLEFADLRMSITDNNVPGGVNTGWVATDDSDFQCPDSQCFYTGFWSLATTLPQAVPEPGSAIGLLSALPLLGLYRKRRKTR